MIILTSYLSYFLDLFVALILGGVIGIERTRWHKTAGVRTYALVSLGSALFVVVSRIIDIQYLSLTNFDPLRVASQIVVGVGFLGAGLIILQDNKLKGLTTAAGLWVAAGIGMAAGFGLYAVALFATILTLCVFTLFWYLEKLVPPSRVNESDNQDN
jgi:putative Mg2+ transporter-C (MgtC) family protein